MEGLDALQGLGVDYEMADLEFGHGGVDVRAESAEGAQREGTGGDVLVLLLWGAVAAAYKDRDYVTFTEILHVAGEQFLEFGFGVPCASLCDDYLGGNLGVRFSLGCHDWSCFRRTGP